MCQVNRSERDSTPVNPIPLYTLFGHDDAVISVAVHPVLDLVISGSCDGSVIVHALRAGCYIRSIYRDPSASPGPKIMPLALIPSVPNPGVPPRPPDPRPYH